MTSIALSDEAAKIIAAAIGTSDPIRIGAFFERLARHEKIMLTLLHDAPNAEDLAAIREGTADPEADRVQSLAELDTEFRQRNGFANAMVLLCETILSV